MPIKVKSEVGALKKVVLHRPGKELEHFVPDEMMRLLFDDIPFLSAAQREHDIFAAKLRENGVSVFYLENLTAETLKANPDLREGFIERFILESGRIDESIRSRLRDFLMEIEDELELVLKMMAGVSLSELKASSGSPLVDLIRGGDRFVMDPIPNLYFTRDPWASIGNGVSMHRMFSSTRRRETIFGDFILHNHPDFRGKIQFYYDRAAPFSIEGGDIFNLSAKVLAVGISERTTPEAVESLARSIFADPQAEVETVLALDIPSKRAFMHLDTVFTQIDTDKFTVHPVILERMRVYEITRGSGEDGLNVREFERCLEDALAKYLELDKVTLINCGGTDRIASEREQWNDGSNTLCVAPGKVIVYDRNIITNTALREHGIEVIEMPSSELSRGRGGPRCMSMPIERAAIE